MGNYIGITIGVIKGSVGVETVAHMPTYIREPS